jgi:thiol:disulfide interchange protein DsbD
LSLDLPAATAPLPPDPAVALLFAAARRQLPIPAPFETRFAELGGDLRVIVPGSALSGLRDPTGAFFPFDDTLIDNAAEPHFERRADGLHIILKKSATAAAHSRTLKGVLVLRADGGVERAFDISANPALALPAKTGVP